MARPRLKTFLLAAAALLIVLGAAVYVWARSVLTGDAVRTAVAAQLAEALGQPVTIGGLGVSIFPRVTMDLSDVAIGKPARIAIRRLHVSTALGALLSRRIEHAGVRLEGARVDLPLPPLGPASSAQARAAPGRAPVEIVSIDDVMLNGVEVRSGGRTLRGDVVLVPHLPGVTIERLDLSADDTHLTITGEITDLAGPTGTLAVRGRGLDVPALSTFLSEFAGGATARAGPGSAAASGGAINLTVTLDADRATFGTLRIDALTGRARVTSDGVAIEPMRFRVFGGTCDGALTLTLSRTPAFRVKAAIANVDVAAALAFAGSPNTMTGRAAGTLDLAGRGTALDRVLETAAGTARIDVTDGTVAHLGLVRTVVLAGSMRAESQRQARSAGSGETFSRLGATFHVGSGAARTDDLRFESPDVLLAAAGEVRLDGRAVDLAGPLQLSSELSKQAGRDLVRYTARDGLVTVPITVDGPLADLKVRVGIADLARRALANRASEELKKSVLKGLGKIIKRSGPS